MQKQKANEAKGEPEIQDIPSNKPESKGEAVGSKSGSAPPTRQPAPPAAAQTAPKLDIRPAVRKRRADYGKPRKGRPAGPTVESRGTAKTAESPKPAAHRKRRIGMFRW